MASEFSLNKGGNHEFNFGPDGESLSVSQLIKEAMLVWEKNIPEITHEKESKNLEAATLQLDSSLSKEILNWNPLWSQEQAIRDTFTWWSNVLHKDISAEEACLLDISKVSEPESR
jgi:CDP-glucose 4,6-dehydratase